MAVTREFFEEDVPVSISFIVQPLTKYPTAKPYNILRFSNNLFANSILLKARTLLAANNTYHINVRVARLCYIHNIV